MYCKNCGNQMDDMAVVCVKCGVSKGGGANYCPNCGAATLPGAQICTHCGVALYPQAASGFAGSGQKSKIAAGLLGIFLGGLGIHNFYLGYTNRGLLQLLVTVFAGILSVFTCGATSIAAAGMSIWGLVEGILILTGSMRTDAEGNPLKD